MDALLFHPRLFADQHKGVSLGVVWCGVVFQYSDSSDHILDIVALS